MNKKTKEEAIAAYATMSKEYADTIDKATELLDATCSTSTAPMLRLPKDEPSASLLPKSSK